MFLQITHKFYKNICKNITCKFYMLHASFQNHATKYLFFVFATESFSHSLQFQNKKW